MNGRVTTFTVTLSNVVVVVSATLVEVVSASDDDVVLLAVVDVAPSGPDPHPASTIPNKTAKITRVCIKALPIFPMVDSPPTVSPLWLALASYNEPAPGAT
jgi:hypothetical protein